MSGARPSRWFYLLAALLVLGGAAPVVVFVGLPLAAMVRAIGYQATSCTIETAHVATRFDADGDPIHSIDVLYSYQVGGTRFQSRRYDLWKNEKGDARRIVATLEPGERVRCFYDPDRPAEAVVDRRLDASGLIALLALLPIAFGVHMGRWTWRRRHWLGRERRRHIELIGARPRRLALRRLGVTLATRLAVYGALGPALLALCLHDRWGILGQLLRGEMPILPAIWVVILLIGAAAATLLFAHTVMRALGPRFALATVQPARRGAPVTIQWRAGGVTPSIRSMSLSLVAREEADYERPSGDSTESGTDSREFHRRELVRLSHGERSRLSHGSVSVELPPFAFSFDGGNNRVRWLVEVTADVAWWADVFEVLELDIAP